jgi:hypothetical protein
MGCAPPYALSLTKAVGKRKGAAETSFGAKKEGINSD